MSSMTYNFDAIDADLILLSSNDAEFRVHRCILAAASLFFAHMFTLPQPPMTISGDTPLPVIPVSEPRQTLDSVLRFVYPIQDPPIKDLNELNSVLGAAFKYDFASVISSLRKILVAPHFLETSPTRVFAIASRYELESEAQLASRYTLNINILDCPLSDDLKHITAHSYHRLLDLHRRRGDAAQKLLQVPDEVKCMQCNGHGLASSFAPPKWWKVWEGMARKELAARPTTDVIFGMEFLAQAADATGCPRCAGSVMDSYVFLGELKRSIDALPATI
jgi:hypothetical protein